ncbi:MAG TPA: transporter substrate-binding domain-containing protein [Candidatus Choladousia intestinigallinarum]|nr:transporter substrate-binding domain-containing protein [Candidatus Choladousia intestinigallinarum]
MKKIISGCLTLSMVFCLASGFTSAAEEQNALERIQESGKLVMATDAAWPPFEFMEGEDVVGVDVAIAQDIADGLGVELEVINVAFDSLSMYLENQEADIAIAAITVTEDRQEVMEFSEPYTDTYQYIVVKEDDDSVETIEDLAGYIIGVHLGTTGDFLASDEVNMGVLAGTGASVQQYKDLTVAALGLNAGDVQAIVCDKLLAENLCEVNEGLKCFEAVYEDGSSTNEQYAIAANKGETELIEAINEIVQPLKEDGTIDQYILDYTERASLAEEDNADEAAADETEAVAEETEAAAEETEAAAEETEAAADETEAAAEETEAVAEETEAAAE